jgi:enediyne biosynthesis protein E4
MQVETENTETSGQQTPVFKNVAAAKGVDFSRFNDEVPGRFFLPEVMGGGVAWLDFDSDGLLDLYSVNGCLLWDQEPADSDHTNKLFRNTHNGFQEVSRISGSTDVRYGQGCAVGDFNSDGFQDLYVTNYGRNTLLSGNGDGTFSDVTSEAGVGCELWSTSSTWLDADQDGLLDLYVVNYLNVTRENHKPCDYGGIAGYCGPGSWEAASDVLYLNSGDGHFKMAEAIAEDLNQANAKGLAVAVADFDGDTVAEVYVANDMAPNFLLKRTQHQNASDQPLYRDVAVQAGCAVSNEGENEASMGIACSDFDGDGLVDIFLTDFYESKNTIYRNLGALFFEDASRQTRIAATSFDKLGFGTVAFDANLDGADDIFIANGHVLGPNVEPYKMTQQLLLNDGRGTFSDVSSSVADYFLVPCLGRGVAGGDFDNDGRVDVAVNHLDLPLALLQNQTPQRHHFIGLELLPGNRCYPAGGRVIIDSAQGKRVIPIVAGGSYLSTNDHRLVIGLAENSDPVDIEVYWSHGKSSSYKKLAVDKYWMLTETGKALLKVDEPERP